MKTSLLRNCRWRLAAAFFVPAVAGSLGAAPTDAKEFPFPIAIEIGSVEFVTGDNITITSLRGDRPHLEPGGRYLLEGNYTLVSVESADLGFSVTTRGPSGFTPVNPESYAAITRGSGTFRLIKDGVVDGWPHVSIYADHHASGGVYFGETGQEQTILRRKGWSDFTDVVERRSVSPPREVTPSVRLPPRPAESEGAAGSITGNAALIAFLGEPVPAPANLDPKYTAGTLAAAFKLLCKEANLDAVQLSVDDSEFPFLVYGLIAGRHDLKEIQSALGRSSTYAYAGSTSGRTDDFTYFALNMIPNNRYPSSQAQAINRRLMIRLQMLLEKVRP